jgi:ribosomal protein S4
LYGVKTKKLKFRGAYLKGLFGCRFYETLSFLELRLDVLSLRLGLAQKSLLAMALINKGGILVNGHQKH